MTLAAEEDSNAAIPRTVAKGRISAALSVEGAGFNGEVGGEPQQQFGVFSPAASGRLGVADRFDVGTRVGILPLYFAADAKWLVLKSSVVDLALDPGLSLSISRLEWADGEGYMREELFYFGVLDAPLVLGVNLLRQVSVILTPGILYGLRLPDHEPYFLYDRWSSVSGFAPRIGIGLDLRASQEYGLRPEATFVWSNDEGEQRTIFTLGVALEFGGLPDRSDIWSP